MADEKLRFFPLSPICVRALTLRRRSRGFRAPCRLHRPAGAGYLSRYPEIIDVTTTDARVEKLWEACALPDYRRIAPAQHADLISTLYFDLVKRRYGERGFHGRTGASRRPHGWRDRYLVCEDCADQNMDLCIEPPRMACRSDTLARKTFGKSRIDCPMRYMKG